MPTGKILFVDDNTDRFESFSENLPDGTGFIYWATSPREAIDTLCDGINFKVICLDHDMTDTQDDCGCSVVKWIVEHKQEFKDVEFFVHSWNPSGALAMHEALVQAGLKSRLRPFSFTG